MREKGKLQFFISFVFFDVKSSSVVPVEAAVRSGGVLSPPLVSRDALSSVSRPAKKSSLALVAPTAVEGLGQVRF